MRIDDPDSWPRRPLIMGIVNVTPDSFSDGGNHFHWEKAVEHGLRLAFEGADILDVGGESTRPGAEAVPEEDELARTLPVVKALADELDLPISIDTRKSAVAAKALSAGATIVNDVSALADPGMIPVAHRENATLCLMHMQGEPGTMQDDPRYEDVLAEIVAFLKVRIARALAGGIDDRRIWIDPGIGFGKALEHNLTLLAGLDRLAALGYPVLLGASRKRFIEEIAGDPVDRRLAGSLAAASWARRLPRSIIRVHDVAATRQYLLVQQSISAARASLLRGTDTHDHD